MRRAACSGDYITMSGALAAAGRCVLLSLLLGHLPSSDTGVHFSDVFVTKVVGQVYTLFIVHRRRFPFFH